MEISRAHSNFTPHSGESSAAFVLNPFRLPSRIGVFILGSWLLLFFTWGLSAASFPAFDWLLAMPRSGILGVDAEGNCLVLGSFTETFVIQNQTVARRLQSHSDAYFIAKLDRRGTLLWIRVVESDALLYPNTSVDQNGALLISSLLFASGGETQTQLLNVGEASLSFTNWGSFAALVNPDGTTRWLHFYDQFGLLLQGQGIDKDRNVFLAGSNRTNFFSLKKLDSRGDEVWTVPVTPTLPSGYVNQMGNSSDGHTFLLSTSFQRGSPIHIAAFAPSGEWIKTMTLGKGSVDVRTIQVSEAGEIYFAGLFPNPGLSNVNPPESLNLGGLQLTSSNVVGFVAKLEQDTGKGDFLLAFTNAYAGAFGSISLSPSGDAYLDLAFEGPTLIGGRTINRSGKYSVFMKLDAHGKLEWLQEDESAYSQFVTRNGTEGYAAKIGWEGTEKTLYGFSLVPLDPPISRTLSGSFLAHFGSDPPQSPFVILSSSSAKVTEGQPLFLRVEAAGNPPPHYQWRLNGQDLSGATNGYMFLPETRASHSGDYDARICNSVGCVTSPPIRISVEFVQGFPEVDWVKQLGATKTPAPNDKIPTIQRIVVARDKKLYISGTYGVECSMDGMMLPGPAAYSEFFVLKYSPSGTLGGLFHDQSIDDPQPRLVQLDGKSGIWIGGRTVLNLGPVDSRFLYHYASFGEQRDVVQIDAHHFSFGLLDSKGNSYAAETENGLSRIARWNPRASTEFINLGPGRLESLGIDASDNFILAFSLNSSSGTVTNWGIPLVSQSLEDVFIAKFSSEGKFIWKRQFSAHSGYAILQAMTVSESGLISVVLHPWSGTLSSVEDGSTLGEPQANVILQFSPDGDISWHRSIDPNLATTHCAAGPLGIVVIASVLQGPAKVGESLFTPTGKNELLIAGFSKNGALDWVRQLGADIADLAVGADGNVFVGGQFNGDLIVGNQILHSALTENKEAHLWLAKLTPRPSLSIETSLADPESGASRIVLQSDVLGRYAIESANDFKGWSLVGTVTNSTGTSQLIRPRSAAAGAEYYRARSID